MYAYKGVTYSCAHTESDLWYWWCELKGTTILAPTDFADRLNCSPTKILFFAGGTINLPS